MNLYTRTGDAGTTDLANGQCTSKTDARMQAIGTLDELNAHLGLSLAEMQTMPALRPFLSAERMLIIEAQRLLFGIGAWAAATPSYKGLPTESHIHRIEQCIDQMAQQHEAAFHGFILPGGCLAAAQLHVARTVCRRAERDLLAAGAADWENAPQALAYINRLSDFLYAAARKTNILADIAEIKW